MLSSFAWGIFWISYVFSIPVALLLLVVVLEPRRQAMGKEPLGYFGCLLHVAVLCLLLLPLGLVLWFLAQEVGDLF